MGYIMLYKMSDLPCLKCPVLAICVTKKIINCSLLLDFLNKYQRVAKHPMWNRMLRLVRKTLRGDWCVVGINNQVTFLEKDRSPPEGPNGDIYYHRYEVPRLE